MMSRITIDLRKDLSREVVVGDEGSLQTYHMSHIRFRDTATANDIRMPHASTSGNPGAVVDTTRSHDPLITTRDSN